MKKITLYATAVAMMAFAISCSPKSSGTETTTDETNATEVATPTDETTDAPVTEEVNATVDDAETTAAEVATETAVATEATEAAAAPAHAVVSVKDDNMFRPDKKVDALTVLDFNATWCVPCKKLTPAYDLAAQRLGSKVKFYSVDIDVNPETARAFNVTSVPTVVILSPNGKMESFVGLGPFIKGLPDGKSNDAAVLTATITENLVNAINAAAK